MRKETNLDKIDRMVDAMAKGDGTLDFLYFRLKFAMEMIDNFKKLYKYENFFKRAKAGKAKYKKANDILDEIERAIENRVDSFEFKDLNFIKAVEDKEDVMVDRLKKSKPRSLKDKAFVKRVEDIADRLHYELNLGEEHI